MINTIGAWRPRRKDNWNKFYQNRHFFFSNVQNFFQAKQGNILDLDLPNYSLLKNIEITVTFGFITRVPLKNKRGKND